MPTDEKITEIGTAASLAATDMIVAVVDPATTPVTKSILVSLAATSLSKQVTRFWRGYIPNPQAVYAMRAQVVLAYTTEAITFTKIEVRGNDSTPTSELTGDMKFADDQFDGSFASATLIAACDTTNGTATITSFSDATVPSGKFVYFQFDASPHADWKTIFIQVHYTVD